MMVVLEAKYVLLKTSNNLKTKTSNNLKTKTNPDKEEWVLNGFSAKVVSSCDNSTNTGYN